MWNPSPAEQVRPRVGGYRDLSVPVGLARACELAWIHQPSAAARAPHRVLPDAGVSLAFRCIRDPHGVAEAPTLLLIGASTKPYMIAPGDGYQMTAIRIKIECVRPLLGLDPADHIDDGADLEIASRGFAARLMKPLASSRSPEAALQILMAALGDRLSRLPRVWAAARLLDAARRSNGVSTVQHVARTVGISTRQLRRIVREEVGLSIKAYLRNLRFLHAVAMSDHMRGPNWARIAVSAGYCDQSHLVREFGAIAGVTPQLLHQERRAEA